MKKRVLGKILIAATLTLFLFGCSVKKEEERVVVEEEPTSEVNVTSETKSEPISDILSNEPSEIPSEEAVDERNIWLEEHGIVISKQGDYTMPFALTSNDRKRDVGEIELPTSVNVTEETDGCPDGYKKVIAVFNSNKSSVGNNRFQGWDSVFDRYTGYLFEYTNELSITSNANPEVHTNGGVIIEANGKEYDVSVEFNTKQNGNFFERKIIVTCPIDYDGAVFYHGFYSIALEKETNEKCDFSKQLYKVDEHPCFNDEHTCYYFTYTDE